MSMTGAGAGTINSVTGTATGTATATAHNVGDDGGRWGGLSPDTDIDSGPAGKLGGMNATAVYLEAMEARSLPNLKPADESRAKIVCL